MAQWDSADLLARVRTEIRQPSSGPDFPQDADLYGFLSSSQSRVLARLSITVPESQYGAPVKLTTTDGGYTFTFGTDADGNNIFPLGEYELYPSKNAIPDSPMSPFSEFIPEGDHIRIPGNLAYSGPESAPYARFLTPALKLDGSTAPVLKPVQARQALVYDAAAAYFGAVGNQPQAQSYAQRFEQEYDTWLVAMRTQAEAMNAEAGTGSGNTMWYTGMGASSRWW